jgi:nucleotide-binding universal stress UspA family protein
LVIAHVLQVPYPPALLRRGLPPREEVLRTALAGAERRLAEAAAKLPQVAHRVVREGRPASALAAVAAEHAVDLVVVGTHGRWGVWTNLGSTADSLLAESPVPVLLAQGFDETPPRHLLVPMDESDNAREALGWAAFLARRFDARLTATHVMSTSLLGHMRLVSSEPAARDLEQRAHTSVADWLQEELRATRLPPAQTSVEVTSGVPGLEILATAARLGCDLVVLGCRGSGGARTFSLGSVASAVVRKGAGPILVVPPARR